MSNENNTEHSPNADEDSLNGLPEGERKETQEILDEIEGEGSQDPKEPEGKKPEDQEAGKEGKPEGEKPESDNPDDKKEGEEDEANKGPQERREMKQVPAFKLAIANKKGEQRDQKIADLEAELARYKNGEQPEAGKGEEETQAPDDESIKALAEKHGISEELAKDLIGEAAKRSGVLPKEVQEKLNAVDELRQKSEIEAEYVQYNADFENLIVPLMKAEYGEKIPAGVMTEVREKLKELAYTPEYAKVPYEVIYKGRGEFRELVAPEKKGAEPGKVDTAPDSGEGKGQDNANLDLTKPLPDEDIKLLSEKDLDIYLKNMETYKPGS